MSGQEDCPALLIIQFDDRIISEMVGTVGDNRVTYLKIITRCMKEKKRKKMDQVGTVNDPLEFWSKILTVRLRSSSLSSMGNSKNY